MAPVVMLLMLWVSIPTSTWHECDHHSSADEHFQHDQILEDHQCDICDYHFSGFEILIASPDNAIDFSVSASTPLQPLNLDLIRYSSSASRAPPVKPLA